MKTEQLWSRSHSSATQANLPAVSYKNVARVPLRIKISLIKLQWSRYCENVSLRNKLTCKNMSKKTSQYYLIKHTIPVELKITKSISNQVTLAIEASIFNQFNLTLSEGPASLCSCHTTWIIWYLKKEHYLRTKKRSTCRKNNDQSPFLNFNKLFWEMTVVIDIFHTLKYTHAKYHFSKIHLTRNLIQWTIYFPCCSWKTPAKNYVFHDLQKLEKTYLIKLKEAVFCCEQKYIVFGRLLQE